MRILRTFASIFLGMAVFAFVTMGAPRLPLAGEAESVTRMTEEEAAAAYKKGGRLESPEEKRERRIRERELQQRSINQVYEHQQRTEDQIEVEQLENMQKQLEREQSK